MAAAPCQGVEAGDGHVSRYQGGLQATKIWWQILVVDPGVWWLTTGFHQAIWVHLDFASLDMTLVDLGKCKLVVFQPARGMGSAPAIFYASM